MKFYTLITAIIIMASISINAQIPAPKNNDNQILNYQQIHDGNLHWMKRVWREIDVNEKMNLVFQYNRLPLYTIIDKAIATGDLAVYSNDTQYPDELQKQITKKEAYDIKCKTDEMVVLNAETFQEDTIRYPKCTEAKDIVRYRIMEDWYFDKNTSTMKVHIISIAPVRKVTTSEGEFIGYSPMYWLHFDMLREILVHYPVYNSKNDASTYSWDDLFLSRVFSSYIIKESNVFDRNIREYTQGVDALLESDRVKEEIFFTEHDVWSY